MQKSLELDYGPCANICRMSFDFWATVCKTVGWIKMKLSLQVGLGPGHIVLDRNPAAPPPKDTAPNFRPMLLRPNGWVNQDVTR